MPRETVTSPTPPGAGRYFGLGTPGVGSYFGGVGANAAFRQNAGQQSSWCITALFVANGAGAGNGLVVYEGAPCQSLICAVATVPGTGVAGRPSNSGPPTYVPLCPAGTFNSGPANPWNVYRTWANIAFLGTPAADQDYGIEVLFLAALNGGANSSIIHDNAPGCGWVKRASGKISFIVNGSGGLAFNDIVTPAGFDPTVFNSYEIIFTGATATQPSTIQALVNGVVYFTFPYSAGNTLPNYNAACGQMYVQVINYAGSNIVMNYQYWAHVLAPTFQDSL
jgi:hypothetical protein